MNAKDKERQRLENSLKYHTPACNKSHRRTWGAVHLSIANSEEHEIMKCRVVYDLMKNGHEIITEAVRDEPDEKGKERRVDVVDLDTGDEYEIETEIKRAKRFINDPTVIVIPCGWSKKDEAWVKACQQTNR